MFTCRLYEVSDMWLVQDQQLSTLRSLVYCWIGWWNAILAEVPDVKCFMDILKRIGGDRCSPVGCTEVSDMWLVQDQQLSTLRSLVYCWVGWWNAILAEVPDVKCFMDILRRIGGARCSPVGCTEVSDMWLVQDQQLSILRIVWPAVKMDRYKLPLSTLPHNNWVQNRPLRPPEDPQGPGRRTVILDYE